jgi:hypothetical protein
MAQGELRPFDKVKEKKFFQEGEGPMLWAEIETTTDFY